MSSVGIHWQYAGSQQSSGCVVGIRWLQEAVGAQLPKAELGAGTPRSSMARGALCSVQGRH